MSPIERLLSAAKNTLAQQRSEFSRGEIADLDELEDAIAEVEASMKQAEPQDTTFA